ncbi:MAG: response regulator [Actinobacteria bacterium]|nr:response regulator [Actinomycetota bacterium]MBU1944227.1 response regulator [Actinomycetota bacterium]MBU2688380.1 response regulator [Actinomycetota bacterium]
MKKVLIADDDPITVERLKEVLKPRDYDVMTVRDGKECLKVAIKEEPDIIILDVVMPVLNGLDALRELRKTSDVPVVVMSAYGNHDKVEEARELGIECFMNKPFDPEVLVEMLDVIFL